MYRQRAQDAAARSQGLERYIYQVFGSDLIGSLALAFDPWAKFTVNPAYTALLSGEPFYIRTRTFITVWGQARKEHYLRHNDQYGYRSNNDTSYPFDYYLTGPVGSTVTEGTSDRGTQPMITGFIRDFTSKKRPLGAVVGEFEMFVPRWDSAGVNYSYVYQDNHNQNHIGTGLQDTRSVKTDSGHCTGPEIVCDNVSTQAMLTACRTRATSAMVLHTLPLLDSCLPEHKTYDLTYQTAELKDLAFTLRASLEVWLAFERTVGTKIWGSLLLSARNWRKPELLIQYARLLGHRTGFTYDGLIELDQLASNAYLTFKFGWASMVQAVSQLLPTPAKISKRVNYLIDRIGKDTSFHGTKKYREKVTSFPTFSGNLCHFESLITNPTTPNVYGWREVEVRCMANVRIQFPKMALPKLKTYLFFKQFGVNLTDQGLGLELTPGQIYNLIPWTWMVDWFSGLGDYIRLMDTITADRSLVNYGFMTYREINHITAGWIGEFVGTHSTNFDGSTDGVHTEHHQQYHTGKLVLKYQLRKALSEVASVKTYWNPATLGSSQKAIITSLLTKFGLGAKHSA
jgi:hypothetical protein